MKQTSVFRVTAEICFYFAVLSVFTALRAWRLSMALFTAVSLLLGLVIVRCKNPAIRLSLSFLPVFCFLPGPFSLLLILPMLAWVYYALVMARGHYAMPLVEYRRIFTVLLAVSLFFIAANIANSTIYRGQVISVDSLAYVAAFLVLGIIAMRRMQMGAEMGLNWQVRNLLSVVGFPLLAVAASLGLFLILRFSHQALSFILAPVGRFFIWLFGLLFPAVAPKAAETVVPGNVQLNSAAIALELDSDGIGRDKFDSDGSNYYNMLIEHAAGIGAWIILGILLLLVFWLIWNHAKRNRPEEEDELLYEETEAAPGKGRRRRNKIPLLAGNARQLRRIYKTYLEYKRAAGMHVQPSDTSAEILERDPDSADSGNAAKLRELYIAARYGNPSAVTHEQVLEAQACLEQIIAK